MAHWFKGMILASGVRDPGVKAWMSPVYMGQCVAQQIGPPTAVGPGWPLDKSVGQISEFSLLLMQGTHNTKTNVATIRITLSISTH